MTIDISFVKSNNHRNILEGILEDMQIDTDIIGIMVLGSHARGDAHLDSDLDLYFLMKDGQSRKFDTKIINKILVEYKYADLTEARSRLETNPMEVYAYIDGKIIFDSEGVMEILNHEAIMKYQKFRMDEEERKALYHWLYTAKIKILGAIKASDYLKAIFITTATSYKILEGLWGVCKKPVPPAGSVIAHINDLKDEVPNIKDWVEKLLLGTTEERVNAATEMIDWINKRLLND